MATTKTITRSDGAKVAITYRSDGSVAAVNVVSQAPGFKGFEQSATGEVTRVYYGSDNPSNADILRINAAATAAQERAAAAQQAAAQQAATQAAQRQEIMDKADAQRRTAYDALTTEQKKDVRASMVKAAEAGKEELIIREFGADKDVQRQFSLINPIKTNVPEFQTFAGAGIADWALIGREKAAEKKVAQSKAASEEAAAANAQSNAAIEAFNTKVSRGDYTDNPEAYYTARAELEEQIAPLTDKAAKARAKAGRLAASVITENREIRALTPSLLAFQTAKTGWAEKRAEAKEIADYEKLRAQESGQGYYLGLVRPSIGNFTIGNTTLPDPFSFLSPNVRRVAGMTTWGAMSGPQGAAEGAYYGLVDVSARMAVLNAGAEGYALRTSPIPFSGTIAPPPTAKQLKAGIGAKDYRRVTATEALQSNLNAASLAAFGFSLASSGPVVTSSAKAITPIVSKLTKIDLGASIATIKAPSAEDITRNVKSTSYTARWYSPEKPLGPKVTSLQRTESIAKAQEGVQRILYGEGSPVATRQPAGAVGKFYEKIRPADFIDDVLGKSPKKVGGQYTGSVKPKIELGFETYPEKDIAAQATYKDIAVTLRTPQGNVPLYKGDIDAQFLENTRLFNSLERTMQGNVISPTFTGGQVEPAQSMLFQTPGKGGGYLQVAKIKVSGSVTPDKAFKPLAPPRNIERTFFSLGGGTREGSVYTGKNLMLGLGKGKTPAINIQRIKADFTPATTGKPFDITGVKLEPAEPGVLDFRGITGDINAGGGLNLGGGGTGQLTASQAKLAANTFLGAPIPGGAEVPLFPTAQGAMMAPMQSAQISGFAAASLGATATKHAPAPAPTQTLMDSRTIGLTIPAKVAVKTTHKTASILVPKAASANLMVPGLSIQEPVSVPISTSISLPTQIQTPVQSSIQTPVQITTPISITTPIISPLAPMVSPPGVPGYTPWEPIIPPLIPLLPRADFGMFDFGPRRAAPGPKRATAYAPSLTAYGLGISGPVNTKGVFTGLELRPIPGLGMKPKKRKRK